MDGGGAAQEKTATERETAEIEHSEWEPVNIAEFAFGAKFPIIRQQRSGE